jgi:hypothetical protein
MALILGSDLNGQQLAEKIAALAAGKQHRLQAFQVDGRHPVTPAAADGIIRYLSRCPDLDSAARSEDAGRARTAADARALGAAGRRPVISDIEAGFYATSSATGNNDLDFWKVLVTNGFRRVKRVIGGGDLKYPVLVEISGDQQKRALGVILRAGISKAREDYADNQSRCMKCGAQLTDDESRATGMGPVCRGKS